jgi:hypothetical protein
MPDMHESNGNDNDSARRMRAANEGPVTVEKLTKLFRTRAGNPPQPKTGRAAKNVISKSQRTRMRAEIILARDIRDYISPTKPAKIPVALEETLALLADRIEQLDKSIASLSAQLAQQSQCADFDKDKTSAPQPAVPLGSRGSAIPKLPTDVVESLVEAEKRTILNALLSTKWNVCSAARILGMGKTTVYRKLVEYKEQQLPRSGGIE